MPYVTDIVMQSPHVAVSLLVPMTAWGNSLTRGFAESEAREAGKMAKSKALKKNKAIKGASASSAEVIVKAAEKRYDVERAKYLAALQTFNASGLDGSFVESIAGDVAAEKTEDADELKERKELHVRFLTLRKEKVAWTSPLPDLLSKVVTTAVVDGHHSRARWRHQSEQWGIPMPSHVLVRSEKAKAGYALSLLQDRLANHRRETLRYTACAKRAKKPQYIAHWKRCADKAKENVQKYLPLVANVKCYLASPQCRHTALLKRTCALTGLTAEALGTSAATWATEHAEMEQFCSAQRVRNSTARAEWESSYSSSDSDEDGMYYSFGMCGRQGQAMPMPT